MLFLAIAACYLLGSVPFGLLIAKIWNVDIRRYGSGNIGATNVFRTLGPIPGTISFVLDLLKGTLAIYLMELTTNRPELIILGAIAVLLGHTFSVFLKFSGGKGSATGLGVLLGLAPNIFIIGIITAALMIIITRYVSVASIVGPIVISIACITLKIPLVYSIAIIGLSLFIIIRHIPNIKRLINNKESKIW